MELKDVDFYHSMELDTEGRLKNVVWIHPQGKDACSDFYEVVSFDTTSSE